MSHGCLNVYIPAKFIHWHLIPNVIIRNGLWESKLWVCFLMNGTSALIKELEGTLRHLLPLYMRIQHRCHLGSREQALLQTLKLPLP
jgi:hypothetical protein